MDSFLLFTPSFTFLSSFLLRPLSLHTCTVALVPLVYTTNNSGTRVSSNGNPSGWPAWTRSVYRQDAQGQPMYRNKRTSFFSQTQKPGNRTACPWKCKEKEKDSEKYKQPAKRDGHQYRKRAHSSAKGC